MNLPKPANYYVDQLRELHDAMQTRLIADLRAQEVHHHNLQGGAKQWRGWTLTQLPVAESEQADAPRRNTLSDVADVRGGDTIYQIDVHADEVLHAFCEEWSHEAPLVLISEGIEGAGWQVFPEGADEADAEFLLIVDPIDGTRNIMYNKRSAWILSGVAPNKGRATTLADIQAAVMTELPTTRALYADQLFAITGGGAYRETKNLVTGDRQLVPLQPSRAETLAHGFASIAKFFPPAKAEIAAFETELLARVLPEEGGENPLVFDDEYISTGGQLYELLVGHDRFLADLRPLFFNHLGLPRKLVCHPYDICTELIAREAGVIVTDETGARLSAPLDIRAEVNWVGYANASLRNRIEPHLRALLQELQEKSLSGEG